MNTLRGLIAVLLFALVLPVQAELEIRITQGAANAIPIAIAPFVVEGANRPAESIGQIVMSDLGRSGRFKPVPQDRFAQPNMGPGNIEFYRWRDRNVDYLVVGRVIDQGNASFVVEFQLFDSANSQQIAGYRIPADASGMRMAAHQVSDLIYEKITGVRGAFNTRIAYITSTPGDYQLQVADADGYNTRTILRSDSPIMSPAWSPDATKIAYVSFENNHSAIYVQNVVTGSREKVSSRRGINGAPAWSPDGNKLALTLSQTGYPEIYVLDLGSGQMKQLTNTRAINTEPAWMPDGSGIVYTSSRVGKPQLYLVPATGGSPRRLTYEGEYNAAPSVGPNGDKIAFINGDGGRFRVGIFDIESGEIRIVTNGSLDESPSFAPNGDMVIYATEEGGRDVLAAVSVDGSLRQSLVLKGSEVREPDWSPFLN